MPLFILSFFLHILRVQPDSTGIIIVEVHSLRNDKGEVAMVLHSVPEAFPSDATKGIKSVYVPVFNKISKFTFTDIPPGVYAIAVFHDEDGDKRLKTGMFGLPKEGWGASNDAKGVLGPPKFVDASFEVKASSKQRLSIKINY